MTRVLNAQRREAASGTVGSIVVFLHGYGANGADLLGLADPLAEHLPDTLFVAPDAPESVPGAPFGFQWFPIPWLDGSSEEEAAQGLARASEDLNAFLDAFMVDEDLLPEQVVLFGFSQGTMMSLQVAPRREDPVAGIVAFSGRLLEPELLACFLRKYDSSRSLEESEKRLLPAAIRWGAHGQICWHLDLLSGRDYPRSSDRVHELLNRLESLRELDLERLCSIKD